MMTSEPDSLDDCALLLGLPGQSSPHAHKQQPQGTAKALG